MNLIELVKDLKRENEFSLTAKEKTWLSMAYNAAKGKIKKRIYEDPSLGEYTETITQYDVKEYVDDIRAFINHLISTDNEFGITLTEREEKWAKGTLHLFELTFNEKQARVELDESQEFVNSMQNIEV